MKKLLAIAVAALALTSAQAFGMDFFFNAGGSFNWEYNPGLWASLSATDTNQSNEDYESTIDEDEEYGNAQAFLESSRIGLYANGGISLGSLGVGLEAGAYVMGLTYKEEVYDEVWDLWYVSEYQKIFIDVAIRAIARLELQGGKIAIQPHIGVLTLNERYQWDDDEDEVFGEESFDNMSDIGGPEYFDLDPLAFVDVGGKVLFKTGGFETFAEVSILLNSESAHDRMGTDVNARNYDIKPKPRIGVGIQIPLM